MAEKKEYLAFKQLVQKGIRESGKTQAEISEACGLSTTHISRMVNQRFINRPTKRTIQKLASELKGVSRAELLEACGYTDEAAALTKDDNLLTEYQKRLKLSLKERAMRNKKDIMKGFKALTYSEGKFVFPSMDSFFQTYEMLWGVEDVQIHILAMGPYKGGGHENAECVCTVEAVWEHPALISRTYAALYYITTGNGNVMVMEAAFDGPSLLEAAGVPDKVWEKFRGYGIEPALLQEVTVIHEKTAEEMAMEQLTSELSNILDRGEGIESTYNGFGFYLEEVPPHLKEFLVNHKKAFCASVAEEELFRRFEFEGVDVFKDYRDPTSCETGYGAAIAAVMTRESGTLFTFYDDKDGNFEDNPSCVICQDWYDTLSYDDMVDKVYEYAKELGVGYIQECYFRTIIYKDLNSIIKVE